MKYFLMCIGANAASLVCLGAAVYLAANEKSGWGWLFFSAIFATSVKVDKSKDQP
jgi:hypothetical protein